MALWDCSKAFEETAREFQHKILEREDQDDTEKAAIILFKVHHQISRNQILQINEIRKCVWNNNPPSKA